MNESKLQMRVGIFINGKWKIESYVKAVSSCNYRFGTHSRILIRWNDKQVSVV